MGNANASEDARRYRDRYPGKEDDPKAKKNLEFYSNQRVSKPDGDYIEEIHKNWFGKYGLLERHHGYIQWLFPIREDGLNSYAQQLQLHEAKAIREDPVLQGRVIRSYELMLDFYGMRLKDRDTGAIERNPDNWKARYSHLNQSFHNYLRITRILKCLGEVGLEHFKVHFVEHVVREIFENNQLSNCKESCLRYWYPVLRNKEDTERMEKLVSKYHQDIPSKRKGVQTGYYNSSEDEDDDDDEDYGYSNNNNNNNSNKNNGDSNNNNRSKLASSAPDVITSSTTTTNTTTTTTTVVVATADKGKVAVEESVIEESTTEVEVDKSKKEELLKSKESPLDVDNNNKDSSSTVGDGQEQQKVE